MGSGVLIGEKHILTAAHISFKRGQSYKIEGTGRRSFQAKCEFISKHFDFAILHSDDLPSIPVSVASLNRGSKYFIMV
jgi:hypothetical protein